MSDQAKLRNVYERKVAAFAKRPSAAKLTGAITVRTAGGTTCEIEGDGWKFTADQPEIEGGNGAGPSALWLANAALGACLAQGFASVFANKGVALKGVEVRVEADYDARGVLGISREVPIGLAEMRYSVDIDSDASEADIMNALDVAAKYSNLLNTFANPLKITRGQVNIRRPEQAVSNS